MFNGGGCVLILGGVDLVTVHGKLEWEALGRTGRIKRKKRHSLKGRKFLGGKASEKTCLQWFSWFLDLLPLRRSEGLAAAISIGE